MLYLLHPILNGGNVWIPENMLSFPIGNVNSSPVILALIRSISTVCFVIVPCTGSGMHAEVILPFCPMGSRTAVAAPIPMIQSIMMRSSVAYQTLANVQHTTSAKKRGRPYRLSSLSLLMITQQGSLPSYGKYGASWLQQAFPQQEPPPSPSWLQASWLLLPSWGQQPS